MRTPRRITRTTVIAAAAVVTLGLAATACGSDDNTNNDTPVDSVLDSVVDTVVEPVTT